MRRVLLPKEDLHALIEEVSTKHGTMIYESDVRGASMAPLIRHGDRIAIQVLPLEQIEEKQIVVYRRPDDTVVAHRLVGVDRQDGSEVAFIQALDPRSVVEKVNRKNIIGKVVEIESPGMFVRSLRRALRIFERRLRKLKNLF